MLCFLVALPALGQLDTGTITGRVVDPTGAVVVGAQVTVTHTGTNFENVTQTNSEGLYRVQALRPGPYRVTVQAAGFKTQVREGFELRVNDTLAVDLVLEVGSTSESILVTDTLPLLQTETSTAGQVLEGQVFYSLPIFQRQLRTVLYFLPGMTQGNTAWPGQLNAFHINGLAGTQIGFFEDGVLATNMYDGNAVNTVMAGVEEANVLTSALPAEYGHTPGGAITIVKKTGTNELHFLAQEMILTRRMFPRGFFELETLTTPRPGYPNGLPYLYQTPDGIISGPVWIPKLYNGKNKTFFTFSFQIPFSNESKYGQYSVPTPEMLEGDVSLNGRGQPIFDPMTTRQDADGNWLRDPIPNNIVPKSRWSNVAKAIIAHDPWTPPNKEGDVSPSTVANNIQGNQALKLWWPSYSFRVDHQFTPNVKAYITMTWNNFYVKNANAAIDYAPYDWNKVFTPQIQYTPSIGLSWVISPTLISETRIGMYRQTRNTQSPYQQAITDTLVNEAKVPGIPSDWYVERLNVGVGSNLGGDPASVATRGNRSIKQDITKISGRHAFKFGYDYLFMEELSRNIGVPRLRINWAGTHGLNPNGTSIPGTGINWAAFLLGGVSDVRVTVQGPTWLPRTHIHSFYFQDDWKIHPTLTLNLGIRYSTESPLTTKNNAISVWDPYAKDDVAGSYPYCPPTGCMGMWTHPKGAWYNRDHDNYQPRVGLAWHPWEKLVVRTGFGLTTQDMGLTWYTSRDEYDLQFTQAAPLGDLRPIFHIDQGLPPITWPALRPDGTVPFYGTNLNSRSAVIVPKNIENPYTMNWNFGIQYQLARNYMVDVTYSGSSGVGLIGNSQWNSRPWGIIPNPNGDGFMDLNDPANAEYRRVWVGRSDLQAQARPWPNWGSVNYRSNFGHSVYHGGTVKLEKRYSHGISVITFYTFSKSIDGNAGNPYLDWRLLRGRSDHDSTHRYVGTLHWELPFGKGRAFLNRGGIVNLLAGGYNLTWNYQIWSSNPQGLNISNYPTQADQYPDWMPRYGNNVILLRRPQLRDNWKDIGGDRYTQSNQNPILDCGDFIPGWGNSCMTYAGSFERGNLGRNVYTKQRLIAANISLSKDIPLKEKLTLQLRFDYQNPFKWFNWTGLTTNLDMRNYKEIAPGRYASTLFGKVGTGEQDISLNGGHPLMWAFVALKW
ncbi:MAG TPA: TonB-dependent receptor [Bryobacteraceae bacterium]|nr:TonB-dependent receptor [Bryobacteraceae bacterium]